MAEAREALGLERPKGRTASRRAALALLWGLTACNTEPAPKRVEVELPDQLLSSRSVKALVWRYDENNQRSVGKGEYDYAVQPPNLASVTPFGDVTCNDSGDGTLSVSVSGVSASTALKCRVVDHIEAPNLGRVDINGGEVRLDVAAYTKDGRKLPDVPITLTTPNTRVVQTSGMKLRPMMIGAATLRAKVADVSKEFSVDVVRKLVPEALPIDDNTRIHFSLEKGRYELVVELESEKRLEMEWRGAPHCNYEGTAKVHTKVCDLRTKGGVAFDNPAFLNSGAKDVSHGGVQIHEVPEH